MSATQKLSTVAREAITKCHDTDRACNYVRKQMAKDGSLDELREVLVTSAIRSAVAASASEIRRGCKASAFNAPRGIDAIASTAGVTALTILDTWPMPGGGLLGDVFGEELLPAASDERAKAAGHVENAAFYERLAERTPRGKRVRDCVTPEQASEFLRLAQANNTRRKASEAATTGVSPINGLPLPKQPRPRKREMVGA